MNKNKIQKIHELIANIFILVGIVSLFLSIWKAEYNLRFFANAVLCMWLGYFFGMKTEEKK